MQRFFFFFFFYSTILEGFHCSCKATDVDDPTVKCFPWKKNQHCQHVCCVLAICPLQLNFKCCHNSNSPLFRRIGSPVTSGLSAFQPHGSHIVLPGIQPQRCSSGGPTENELAAFQTHLLQAAISHFFSFPRHSLVHFGTKRESRAPEPPESRKVPLPPSYTWQFARSSPFLARFPFKIIAFGKLWQQCIFPNTRVYISCQKQSLHR